MANTHFGNLADVFKHVVLAEALANLRPGEYWESHAGRALNDETDAIPPERSHGIHTFWRLAQDSPALRQCHYARALLKSQPNLPTAEAPPLRHIPGSALLARRLWGRAARRFLLCDTDSDSLLNVRQTLPTAAGGGGSGDGELAAETLECVAEDGISVLRGAGILLPAEWTASVLAFLDPCDLEAPSDAGINALQLACELANREIKVLLFYTFHDEDGRRRRQETLRRELAKARLPGPKDAAQWFEGSLRLAPMEPPPTQWGFGMLALHLPETSLTAIDRHLRGLETAYAGVELTPGASGAWRYTRGIVQG
jgi:hypothetical protein